MHHFQLIADSGSTKTDWVLLCPSGADVRAVTIGMNPFMTSFEVLTSTLQRDLLPALTTAIATHHKDGASAERIHFSANMPLSIHFYGAGCRGTGIADMETALRAVFPHAELHIASDLLGAARSLCRDEEGIACILGTGSNSCLYDGKEVRENVSPLGYILGDEGSGAVLGRRLVGDVLKHQLPEEVCRLFQSEYGNTTDEIIRRVYREPNANRYLASFAPFLGRHRNNEAVRALILDEFRRFFLRNIEQYGHPELRVHFVGSIAYFLRTELQTVTSEMGYRIGRILRSPIEGLKAYHSERAIDI